MQAVPIDDDGAGAALAPGQITPRRGSNQRAPARDWRIPLALLALALLALVLACWPLRAFVGALLERVVGAYGDLLAGAVVLALLLALAGGVGIIFALRRRIAYQAEQAAIVHAPNAIPMHVADLRRISTTQLLTTLERFYANQDTWAQHSALRNVQTYGPTVSYRVDQRPTHPATPAAFAPPGDAPISPPDLAQAIRRGWSTPDQWLVGLDPAGQPQTIALKHAGFIAIAGVQGTGKTHTAAWLAAQAAAHGGYLFLADPHADDPESLSARCQPLSGAVERLAVTPEAINRLVRLVDQIYQRRVERPQPAAPPVVLIMDEFMDMLARQQLADDPLRALLALSGVGRKKRVFVVLIAQNWSERLLGRAAVGIRQNVTHALVHRSSRETAEFLLPSAGYAGLAATAAPGQLVSFGGGEPTLTTVPWLAEADLAWAARGRPPRDYRTWADHPAAPAPPEMTVAHGVPPTTPLPAPTLAEHILALVRARGPLLGTEIVAAIVATTGADRVAAFNELTTLSKAGALRQSGRRGRYVYERT
jgi:hypothetical protein